MDLYILFISINCSDEGIVGQELINISLKPADFNTKTWMNSRIMAGFPPQKDYTYFVNYPKRFPLQKAYTKTRMNCRKIYY